MTTTHCRTGRNPIFMEIAGIKKILFPQLCISYKQIRVFARWTHVFAKNGNNGDGEIDRGEANS